jgi:hypothetical protein
MVEQMSSVVDEWAGKLVAGMFVLWWRVNLCAAHFPLPQEKCRRPPGKLA